MIASFGQKISSILLVLLLPLFGKLPAAQTVSALRTPGPAPAVSEPAVSAAGHIEALRNGFLFPHQTLRYEAEYRLWTAGVATIRVEQNGTQQHVQGTADSNGVVAMLFRVQDRFDSYFDSHSLCSQSLNKHTEEGSHHRDTNIVFDYKIGKAVLNETNLKTNQKKREEHDIPPCVTDVLSGVLYLSSLPLEVGQTYSFPLNDGGKTVTIQAHVEAKEDIKIPPGTFHTVRVGPEGDYGPLKNHGRILIWYTDDAQHLPIQVKAKLFWGNLTVYLAGADPQK